VLLTASRPNWGTEATICLKCFEKSYRGGQTGADRAGLDFAIETGLEHGGYVPRGRKADRVESVIREKIVYLAGRPGGGHWRKDLAHEPVKFFPVYSYLIVYRPETSPLQVVAILHGRRDVEELLKDRLPA